jgi:hypothetical protein
VSGRAWGHREWSSGCSHWGTAVGAHNPPGVEEGATTVRPSSVEEDEHAECRGWRVCGPSVSVRSMGEEREAVGEEDMEDFRV